MYTRDDAFLNKVHVLLRTRPLGYEPDGFLSATQSSFLGESSLAGSPLACENSPSLPASRLRDVFSGGEERGRTAVSLRNKRFCAL